jgi:uracil-DNA glycosylase family 4
VTPSRAPCHNPDRVTELEDLARTITACRRCPRLVAHRESVAVAPPRRYRGERYWARPLPGFGDPAARLLVVGLAPAAHGGNRTGRMFTGDRSATWLADALHHAGFATQPTSEHREDGLRLREAWITAAVRCAPPDNRPTPAEQAACQAYLLEELRLLERVRVVVALGRVGWQAYLRARRALGQPGARRPPVFGHGAVTRFDDGVTLLASYHPSQQNTFTGRLTRPMLRGVFGKARRTLERLAPGPAATPGGAGISRQDRTAAADARPRRG